jgi:hypothetical protein
MRPEAVVLDVTQGVPKLFFRRLAYERVGLTRAELDAGLGLTDAEFRVEGELVALGPIYDVEALGALLDELEGAGLTYFEDYFELSGSWPEWLAIAVRAAGNAGVTAAS